MLLAITDIYLVGFGVTLLLCLREIDRMGVTILAYLLSLRDNEIQILLAVACAYYDCAPGYIIQTDACHNKICHSL